MIVSISLGDGYKCMESEAAQLFYYTVTGLPISIISKKKKKKRTKLPEIIKCDYLVQLESIYFLAGHLSASN